MSLKLYAITLFLLCIISLISCRNSVSVFNTSAYKIHYLDEFVFNKDSIFSGSVIGGLSGIDYDKKTNEFFVICDDAKHPRFYDVTIKIDKDRFSELTFRSPVSVTDYKEKMQEAAVLDMESIRKMGDQLLLSSEGAIKQGYHPSIFVTDTAGNYQYSFQLPSYFCADSLAENQPRHNAVFEGLALDIEHTGFWAASELPLVKDGTEPNYKDKGAPTRITHFNTNTKKADMQFAYPLDKLAIDPKGRFGVNGVTALLQLDTYNFLILERAYAAGYGTQGNTVRIYLTNISKATNTLDIPVFENTTIVPAKKILLFDFETVRDQLKNNIVDNLEGMTFGPILSNGNPSLILIADNNFNPPTEQLNQFILLELVKK